MISQGQERIQRLELQLKEQKALTEKALKDYELLNQRTLKLSQDLEDQINTNTQLVSMRGELWNEGASEECSKLRERGCLFICSI